MSTQVNCKVITGNYSMIIQQKTIHNRVNVYIILSNTDLDKINVR